MKSKSAAPLHFRKYSRLPIESSELIHQALRLLIKVPNLCSREGAVIVVPSILYMVLGVLRESSRVDTCYLQDDKTPIVPDMVSGQISTAATSAIVVCFIKFVKSLVF